MSSMEIRAACPSCHLVAEWEVDLCVDQEIAWRLNQVYHVLLGEDYYDAVARLHMLDPQAAIKELQQGLDRISKPASEVVLVAD